MRATPPVTVLAQNTGLTDTTRHLSTFSPMRWGLHSKLWGAFAGMIVAVMGIGALGFGALHSTEDVVQEIVADRWVRARTSHEATSLVNANLESRLTLFLVPDSASRADLLAQQAEQSKRITDYFDQLGPTVRTPEERALFEEVQRRRAAYLTAFSAARTLLTSRHEREAAAMVTHDVLPRADAYLVAWRRFEEYQNQRVDRAASASAAAYETTRRRMVLAVTAVALLAGLFAILVWRSIAHPLRRMRTAAQRIADGDVGHTLEHHSNDELGALADAFRQMTTRLRAVLGAIDETALELSGTAGEIASSSEELTASADEVSTAAHTLAGATVAQREEIASMARVAAEVAARADAVAEQTAIMQRATSAAADSAVSGTGAARGALDSIVAISAAARDASPLVAELAEKADAIALVTSTVETIARQTNLLSLNAAIEAARAGEHGRGFTVVAEEVRKLADESARALTDIFRLVGEVRGAVDRTRQQVAVVGARSADGEIVIRASAASLAAIATQTEESRAAAVYIATLAAEQQAHAAALAGHVSRAAEPAATSASIAEQVSASMQAQAAAMEQLSRSGQDLASTADRLTEVTSRFRAAELVAPVAA
jgi:methyl-accepting chemotaxis protein